MGGVVLNDYDDTAGLHGYVQPNKYTHTHTHTHTQAQGAQGLQVRRVEIVCHLCRVRSEVFIISIIDPLIPLGRIDEGSGIECRG